jgi:maleylpyruvate isomerase
MILYQTALSSYSLKVRLALALKGCSVELREPPEGSYRSAAYRALVPAATVPALVDGRVVLTESDAIIEYVEETKKGALLLPPDPAGRARARMMSRRSVHRGSTEATVTSIWWPM